MIMIMIIMIIITTMTMTMIMIMTLLDNTISSKPVHVVLIVVLIYLRVCEAGARESECPTFINKFIHVPSLYCKYHS